MHLKIFYMKWQPFVQAINMIGSLHWTLLMCRTQSESATAFIKCNWFILLKVLGKDMETKEKTLTKITSQLQEMTTKFHETDRQKHQSLLQLEDALKRLRDTTREAENLANELRHVQAQLDEADKKREEIKARAQETVKQWVHEKANLSINYWGLEKGCNFQLYFLSCYDKISMCSLKQIEACTKWPNFCRWHFKMHILDRNVCIYFDQNFPGVCS